MLTIDDFQPVTLEHRPLFEEQYRRFPQVHSDNIFSNLVCWNHYAHYRFAHVRDSILICSAIDGQVRFRAPIGPDDPTLLEDLFALAKTESPGGLFYLLDPASRARIAARYPALTLRPVRDLFEYVYRTTDLADLPGRGYLTIRRQISRFRRNCSSEVEAITARTIEEVRVFVNRWCNWKDCENDPLLKGEREAVLFALAHFEELGLDGIAIRVDGEVAAMTVFEMINPGTALVHFEKGLPDCEGIYKAINQETARRLRETCSYINRESDMGVPGLREAKTRYHPHHMVEVHAIAVDDL
ncbi:MAG TPA: phosphatidylglycerol lysyltransferase domain-containing protein [Methanoregulaceae archaeon]|nr:phosphatidylglycerol lysyltransferase domain-containing protein [Methanoregulaceae archaeon]HQJ87505.1 phosphatidylglycerol lysyltransferase domain-containing protein [Methanoregulaceae archaeon]